MAISRSCCEYHPGNENPTTATEIAPIATLDTAGFPGIDFHFVTRPLEKKVLPSEINQETINRGEAGTIASGTTQTISPGSIWQAGAHRRSAGAKTIK
jgi:hypothetical protein